MGRELRDLLALAAFVLLLWSLLFGVTWNGVHHGISCTRDRGVVVR